MLYETKKVPNKKTREAMHAADTGKTHKVRNMAELFDSVTVVKNTRVDAICRRIVQRVNAAKQNVLRSIDTEMVKTYWLVGKEIIEEELRGKKRAAYGAQLLEMLSEKLTRLLGKGYTTTNLRYMKQFYLIYQELIPIHHAVRDEFNLDNVAIPLSWTHYRLLIKVDRKEAREFYEKEAIENRWSSRELERQIGSLLFDRLAKSRNKKGLLRLAKKGQEIQNPEDAIKEPIVLEFLNIPESHRLVESKLEEALISNLQIFAKKYQFHLPTEAELEAELKRELKNIKYRLAHESQKEGASEERVF